MRVSVNRASLSKQWESSAFSLLRRLGTAICSDMQLRICAPSLQAARAAWSRAGPWTCEFRLEPAASGLLAVQPRVTGRRPQPETAGQRQPMPAWSRPRPGHWQAKARPASAGQLGLTLPVARQPESQVSWRRLTVGLGHWQAKPGKAAGTGSPGQGPPAGRPASLSLE